MRENKMTSRRGFLSSIIAAAAAPAVVKASSLMKLVPTESGILTYKAVDRYDLSNESLERMITNIHNSGAIQPTRLIVPATMMAEALKILNQEFGRAYTTYMDNL